MQVKAQIVAALKAMTSNLQYGDQVSHLLNSNPIWAEYRDQKHDLFITDSNVRGYLTGELFDTIHFIAHCHHLSLFLSFSLNIDRQSNGGLPNARTE